MGDIFSMKQSISLESTKKKLQFGTKITRIDGRIKKKKKKKKYIYIYRGQISTKIFGMPFLYFHSHWTHQYTTFYN